MRSTMMCRPELVAGAGRCCTRLMSCMGGRAAIKTGAEGVYVAIVPELSVGVAVKIEDGATRAAEAVIAQLLVGLGVLDAEHPDARAFTHGSITNWRGIRTGQIRLADTISDWRA